MNGECLECDSTFYNLIKTLKGYECREKCGTGVRLTKEK